MSEDNTTPPGMTFKKLDDIAKALREQSKARRAKIEQVLSGEPPVAPYTDEQLKKAGKQWYSNLIFSEGGLVDGYMRLLANQILDDEEAVQLCAKASGGTVAFDKIEEMLQEPID